MVIFAPLHVYIFLTYEITTKYLSVVAMNLKCRNYKSVFSSVEGMEI